MLPRRVKHLLVAGRAIGGDKIAHAATRNKARCAVARQGAEIAAALSIRYQRPLDQVDIGQLHQELDRQGVRHR